MAPRTRTRAGAATRTRNGQESASSNPSPPIRASQPPSRSKKPPKKSLASARTKQNPIRGQTNTYESLTADSDQQNRKAEFYHGLQPPDQDLQQPNTEDSPRVSPPDPTQPDLQNYAFLFSEWPMGRIKQQLQEQKALNSNRAPTEVQDKVKLIFRNFNHELLMLAMIGGVSLSTIKLYM